MNYSIILQKLVSLQKQVYPKSDLIYINVPSKYNICPQQTRDLASYFDTNL